MNPVQLTFYLQERKAKASQVANWCLNSVPGDIRRSAIDLSPGWAMFYGVDGQTVGMFRQACEEGRALYVDNGYFDYGNYYRVTANAVQHSGIGTPNWKRYEKLGIKFKDWRRKGRKIVITLQSGPFFQMFDRTSRYVWLRNTVLEIRRHSWKPIIVREKPHPTLANYDEAQRAIWDVENAEMARHDQTLEDLFKEAHAVVCYSSRTAIDAVMAGVPAFCTKQCAMSPVAPSDLSKIEDPFYPETRERWAAVLAGQQWTPDELERGLWTKVMGGKK